MQVALYAIGKNKGVVLPDPVLAQTGLDEDDHVNLLVENGAIVLRKLEDAPRQGWADAARSISAHGDDDLIMGEFSNAADQEMHW